MKKSLSFDKVLGAMCFAMGMVLLASKGLVLIGVLLMIAGASGLCPMKGSVRR